jgi:hypothetical protein
LKCEVFHRTTEVFGVLKDLHAELPEWDVEKLQEVARKEKRVGSEVFPVSEVSNRCVKRLRHETGVRPVAIKSIASLVFSGQLMFVRGKTNIKVRRDVHFGRPTPRYLEDISIPLGPETLYSFSKSTCAINVCTKPKLSNKSVPHAMETQCIDKVVASVLVTLIILIKLCLSWETKTMASFRLNSAGTQGLGI